MNLLKEYESAPDQLINISKCFFYTPKNCHIYGISTIKHITSFCCENFAFTYLGCPIYSRHNKISYFHDLIQNI